MPRKRGAGILVIHEAAIPDLDDPLLVSFLREEHTSVMFKPLLFWIFLLYGAKYSPNL